MTALPESTGEPYRGADGRLWRYRQSGCLGYLEVLTASGAGAGDEWVYWTGDGDSAGAARRPFDPVDGPLTSDEHTDGSASTSEGWACPAHGYSHITTLTSRKGRKYRACATCYQFEKGEVAE